MSSQSPEDRIAPEIYVLVSLACACVSRSPAAHISAVIPKILRMPTHVANLENGDSLPSFVAEIAEDCPAAFQRFAMEFAQAADDAGIKLTDYADIAPLPYTRFSDFITDFITGSGSVAAVLAAAAAGTKSVATDAAAPSLAAGGTITAAIQTWVAPRSFTEQSRRGSAVRQFVAAVGLAEEDSLASLTGIATTSADVFLRYAAEHPLKGRGAQARLSNVRKFIDAVQLAGIAVPALDWEGAIRRVGASE